MQKEISSFGKKAETKILIKKKKRIAFLHSLLRKKSKEIIEKRRKELKKK